MIKKFKQCMAVVIAILMTVTCLSVSCPMSVEAAGKYVKSLKVASNVSLTVGEKKTIKPVVKVAGKASTKLKVKSANNRIVKASYSKKSKKNNINCCSSG